LRTLKPGTEASYARAAEGALEIGMALLVDDPEAGALVGSLRGCVADEDADLHQRMATLAAAVEDRVQ
jgi:hypothetical protein